MTELEIFKKCLSLGTTEAGAAGCTANILTESVGRSNNVENRCPLSDGEYTRKVDDGSYADFVNDRYGYGLCQWTLPARKQKLLDYAKGHGVSIGDENTQFQFMAREMREDYPYVWNVLTHTSDAYEAGYTMCMQYERPANTEASSEARGKKAREIYDRCKGVSKTAYDPQKVIEVALSEVGYHEKASNAQLDDPKANPGDKNYTKYARDLDALGNFYNGKKQSFAYCDVFTDWCFVKAYGREAAQKLLCQPDNSLGAGCAFSAQYFNAAGRFSKTPQPGAQIFFGKNFNDVWHTGIVVEVTSTKVVTVEGNTSDMVAKRSYALRDGNIFGYGIPNWGMSATPAQKPAAACKVSLPELKVGSKGNYVKLLQRQLIAMGYDCGNKKLLGVEKPDGEFGNATKLAVLDLQKKNNLTQDGEVGEKTWPCVLNY